MNEMSSDEVKEILLESPNRISDLIRATTHIHRLQVLASLIDGPREFGSLLDVVKISKTALANHLAHLLRKGLISRSGRGMYEITTDGRDLCEAIALFYKNSETREMNQIEQLKTQYSQGYRALEVKEKVVVNPPVMQEAQLTYIGAVTGVLQWLGVECDTVDVGGYSGYAFLVNVAKGKTCLSGPTAHAAWEEIHKGTESLGWKLKSFDEKPFPLSETATSEDRERASRFFNVIKKEIDERGNPVVVWGIPVPEYGIVIGYKGDSYIASTVRRFNNQPETPIRYDELQAPGCMEAIFFVKKIQAPQHKDKDALNRILRMTDDTSFVKKGYVKGPAAYDEWATVLETCEPEIVDYFGTSYVGACVYSSKGLAARFLDRLAQKYDNPQADLLRKAAREYYEAETLLHQFVNIFSFLQVGEMTPETCKKGADILRVVKGHEVAAITYLKRAYQKSKINP